MKLFKFAFLISILATPASAQWQVNNNAIPLGKGAGKVGFGTVGGSLGTGTQCLLDTVPPAFGACGAGGLPSLSNGRIWVGNGSNVATAVVMSGDCTIVAAGAITCTKTNGSAFGPFATGTDATNLTGTVASGRLTGSYTGITGLGTLTAGATGAGFTVAFGSSTFTGNIPSANVSGNYTNITGVGTITSGAWNGTVGATTPSTVVATTGLYGGTVSALRLAQKLETSSTANYGGGAFTTWSTNGSEASILDLNKSKSATPGTFTAVAAADKLGYLAFRGSDGSAFQNSALIEGAADGTVSAGIVPGKLTLYTANSGGSMTARETIDSAGNTVFNVNGGTLKMGGTGIGGIPGCLASDGASPATITAGACGTGLPAGGAVGQMVLNVAAGTGNWFTPEKYNVSQNASTDCTGAVATVLSTVIGTNVNALIPPGCTIKVSADDTIPATKTLTVACGATITVDNTKTLTINATFFDPGQCAIFAGAGTVTGISRNRPEWWSCPGNTGAFDQGCIQKAINSMAAATSNGTERAVIFSCKTYYISATVTYTLASGGSGRLLGCGAVANFGSTIITKSSFTGSSGLVIDGGASACCFDFYLKGVALVNEAAAGGPSVGINIGSTNTSGANSFSHSYVEDVSSSGYAFQWYVHDIRQITFTGILGVSSDNSAVEVTNATCIKIDGNTGFAGDFNFFNLQCVGNFGSGTPNGTGVFIAPNGSGNDVAGIRFYSAIFYGSATQFNITTASAAFARDIWIINSQFEGPTPGTSTAVSMTLPAAAVDGSFQIKNNYMSGNGFNKHIEITSGAGASLFNVDIQGNMLANANGAFSSVKIDGNSGDSRGHIISNNIFYGPSNGPTQPLIVVNNSTRYNVNGNVCNGSPTSRTNFIALTVSQFFMAVGNNSAGCTVSGAVDTTGSTLPWSVSGNI